MQVEVVTTMIISIDYSSKAVQDDGVEEEGGSLKMKGRSKSAYEVL